MFENSNVFLNNLKPELKGGKKSSLRKIKSVDKNMITPFYGDLKRPNQERVQTSPVKVKFQDQRSFNCHSGSTATQTVAKRAPTMTSLFQNENEAKFWENSKENFFSPNYSSEIASKNKKFSSDLKRRNLQKEICVSKKPALTSTESRNKLIEYSKSKKFKEDFSLRLQKDVDIYKISNNNKLCAIPLPELNEEEESDHIPCRDEEEKQKRISEYKNKLPVPEEKKDDEKFKILKMKNLKRKSVPNNKSAKCYDKEMWRSNHKQISECIFFTNT
jgi:hypothetical protein